MSLNDYNWDNVFQSIREIWMPVGIFVLIMIVLIFFFTVLKKKGK
jgi:hypothetical protein